jgi:hypothetical protein
MKACKTRGLGGIYQSGELRRDNKDDEVPWLPSRRYRSNESTTLKHISLTREDERKSVHDCCIKRPQKFKAALR